MNKELKPAILTTARALFNERGYNEVSLRDIAKALDISVGNLTYYYKKKEELVEAVVLEQHKAYQKLPPLFTLEDLDGFFTRILAHQRENIYYFRHYRQLAHLSQNVQEIQQKVIEDMYDTLRTAFATLRDSGLMAAESLPGQTERVFDALFSVFVFGTVRNREERAACIWALLYPFLTPAGQTVYRTRIAPHLSKKCP